MLRRTRNQGAGAIGRQGTGWVPLRARRVPATLSRRTRVTLVLVCGLSLLIVAFGASTSTRSVPATSTSADRVTSLPGLGAVNTTQFAGYASVRPAPCANLLCSDHRDAGLFYWYVAARHESPTTPTVLWTNGGPGSSSFWGFFTENGPYSVSKTGQLHPRALAWNDSANYLMFEHPLGVGLSFAPDSQLPANLQQGIGQWYQALLHFLDRHPDIAARPIILAGESYGGTYEPLLAKAILDGNARAGRPLVHLGGVVITAGWVDPVVQQSMDTTYAVMHGLITSQDKVRLDQLFAQCQLAVAAQTPSSTAANDVCGKIKSGIGQISGRYLLNIGATGDPPTDPMKAYLNRADVRKAIHAKRSGQFTLYSEAIYTRYATGEEDSYRPVVQEVLDRAVPVMVVSGLNDATDVNFLGTGAWLALLQGERAATFRAAPTTQWKEGGQVLGYIQQGGGLSWVQVLNAGHLVVLDQPHLIDLVRAEAVTSKP
jgi:vitellogenic carboxypeptidase-like protein